MVVLFIYLILENIFERFIPILSYSDEVLTIAALIGILFGHHKIKIKKIETKIVACFVGVVLIGGISSMVFNIQKESVAIWKDILSLSKFFVIYLYGLITLRYGIKKQKFDQICIFIKIYLIILLASGLASQIINTNMTGEIRFYIKSFVFLYSHETFLVSSVVILIAVLIADGILKNKVYVLIGFIILVLTMRSKAFVFPITIIILEFFFHKKRFEDIGNKFFEKNKKKIISGVILTGIVTFLFVKDKLFLYIGYGITAARPALYLVSFQILYDYFPLGSGFGTFASYLSGKYYSPLYSMYGIQYVTGLESMLGYSYISDTYWPYIIAQFGFLGTILYCKALFYVAKNVISIFKKSLDTLIAATGILIYMLAACFVESLLTNSSIIIIALALSYYLNIKKEQ